jgi:hypothetical protein|uniref:hypothetical protein n=1 Tax=Prosthecobacter sp. TaxID=1965333 RepID=UPI00378489C5
MKRDAREFIRSTTTLLDHVLATLTQEEQHALAGAQAMSDDAKSMNEILKEDERKPD